MSLAYGHSRRICVQCASPLPTEKFRTLPAGGVSHVCMECEDTNKKARKASKKAEKAKKLIQDFVAASRSPSTKAPHISELAAGMIRQFGSLERFCEEYKAQIDNAITNKAGSKTVLDQFYAIAKIIGVATENQSTAPGAADVSDADLERELIELLGANELTVYDGEGEDDVA